MPALLKDMNVMLACLVVTVPLFVFFVIRPWLSIRTAPRPGVKEWQEIAKRIQRLTADDIVDTRWSEPSKSALQLVLRTATPGAGRLENVPFALDTVHAPFGRAESEYRALSSQSIVLGLLGTVVTFTLLFASNPYETSAAADATGKLLAKLSTVYLVNAIALFFGACFAYQYRRIRDEGDTVVAIAQSAFARLHDDVERSSGPLIATALERGESQSHLYPKQLFEEHFRGLGALLGEVRGVGEALRTLVNRMVDQTGGERETVRAAVRENAATVERLTERLDEGFKLLAQPFLQGIPAMDSLAVSAEAIRESTREALSQFAAVIDQFRESAERIERLAAGLPPQPPPEPRTVAAAGRPKKTAGSALHASLGGSPAGGGVPPPEEWSDEVAALRGKELLSKRRSAAP